MLFEDAYPALRRLAATWFNRERVDHTLQPTAIVHEAYLRLLASDHGLTRSRAYFMAAATRAMTQVLIAHARQRSAAKRGSGWSRVPLSHATPDDSEHSVEFDELKRAIEKLARSHERACQVVELRFLFGFSVDEVSRLLGVSRRTVEIDWRYARAWLISELNRRT